MHRNAAYMAPACKLCHGANDLPVLIGSSAGTVNNPGLGCSGCHNGAGLRKHHVANGVIDCYDCQAAEVAPAENVKPPYYGIVDTKANNPGNTVLATNINENWSVGDFLGLDNDGNNLCDLADYAIGPYRLLSLNREGNNIRVLWQTAGGRTNTVQAAAAVAGVYADVSSAIAIPGVGLVTNNYVDVGGATNPARFYRLKSVVPQPAPRLGFARRAGHHRSVSPEAVRREPHPGRQNQSGLPPPNPGSDCGSKFGQATWRIGFALGPAGGPWPLPCPAARCARPGINFLESAPAKV